jgi:hypothetical protein
MRFLGGPTVLLHSATLEGPHWYCLLACWAMSACRPNEVHSYTHNHNLVIPFDTHSVFKSSLAIGYATTPKNESGRTCEG